MSMTLRFWPDDRDVVTKAGDHHGVWNVPVMPDTFRATLGFIWLVDWMAEVCRDGWEISVFQNLNIRVRTGAEPSK